MIGRVHWAHCVCRFSGYFYEMKGDTGGLAYKVDLLPSKFMQLVASDAILPALEELRADSSHGTMQDLVSSGFSAFAVNQWKECVEALPVYVEVFRNGIPDVR